MDTYASLRSFCRRGVMVMAILMSLVFMIDFKDVMSDMLYLGLDGEGIKALFTGLGTILIKGFVVLDLWLITGCAKGGGSFIKVIMTMYRVLMYILLVIVVILTVVFPIKMLRAELGGVVFTTITTFAGLIVLIVFASFLFMNIARIASDMNYRLHTENRTGLLYSRKQVRLGGYLITLLVFTGVGILTRLYLNFMYPDFTDALRRLVNDVAFGMGYDTRRALTEALEGILGNGISVRNALMIVIYIYGLVLLGMYKRLMKE